MIGADEQHSGQVPTNAPGLVHDQVAEDEMHHDDSDHEQAPEGDMVDDMDFPDPLLWGEDHDETDEDEQVEDDMESDEDDNMNQEDLGVLDADLPLHLQEHQLRMWNLRGQLGVLCVPHLASFFAVSSAADSRNPSP